MNRNRFGLLMAGLGMFDFLDGQPRGELGPAWGSVPGIRPKNQMELHLRAERRRVRRLETRRQRQTTGRRGR